MISLRHILLASILLGFSTEVTAVHKTKFKFRVNSNDELICNGHTATEKDADIYIRSKIHQALGMGQLSIAQSPFISPEERQAILEKISPKLHKYAEQIQKYIQQPQHQINKGTKNLRMIKKHPEYLAQLLKGMQRELQKTTLIPELEIYKDQLLNMLTTMLNLPQKMQQDIFQLWLQAGLVIIDALELPQVQEAMLANMQMSYETIVKLMQINNNQPE